MGKRKIAIIVAVIISIVVSLGSVVICRNIKTSKNLEEFNKYVEGFTTEISNYIIDQHKDEYEELLITSEKLVENKEIKSIENLKDEFTNLKKEVMQDSLELINNNIAELENIDISKFEDKVSVEGRIDQKKNLLEFNEDKAMECLLKTKYFSFLVGREFSKYPDPHVYLSYFDFVPKNENSQTYNEVYLYDPDSSYGWKLEVNPQYSGLKYYIVETKERHPDGAGGSVRYQILSGIIYENGIYEEGGYIER